MFCTRLRKDLLLVARRVTLLITGRNEVVAKVMFLLMSVILLTGGVSGRENPPGREIAPGVRPPQQGDPLARSPPGRETPPSRENPLPLAGRTPLPPAGRIPPGIRSMSGRYASYWNAFLFTIDFVFFSSILRINQFLFKVGKTRLFA